MAAKVRPGGVVILAILMIIGGILQLDLTIATIYFIELMLAQLGLMAYIFLALSLTLAILYFTVAYGLWVGVGWAWATALILAMAGIASGIFTPPRGSISIAINAVVAYYLTRPHVKAFFRKK